MTTPSNPTTKHPVINLRTLTQTDLYTLSQTTSSFNLHNQNDVVYPKINKSVFNESSGSHKQTYSRLTTLHRRKTPHLRPSLTYSIHVSDPDHSENTRIISLLKELCKTNPSLAELGHLEPKFEVLDRELVGIKRKRGRPRKHENVVFIRPPGRRGRGGGGGVKKEVVYDEERDKVIGEVDVVGIGRMEDVFGAEIRRRTSGLGTEEEMLEFMRGLNGQWGSRRRKRRVVDASEFGDVLPQGWKVSLCIKKKEGRVWLFCRRFISPSGRQFESCKDISAYLISVIGEENLDKQNHVTINTSTDVTLKETSVNAADLLQEDIKIDDHVDKPSSSSSPSASPSPSPSPSPSSSPPQAPAVPTNNEEQLTLHGMEVQVEDDVKNDNIGFQSEIEKTEQLLAPTTELDCDPNLMTGDDVVVETNDAHYAEKPKPASPCDSYKISSVKESNTDEIVHDLNIVSDNKQDGHTVDRNIMIEESCHNEVSRTDQTPDVTVSQSELFCDEVTMSETSNEIPAVVKTKAVSETGLLEKDIVCEEKGFDANMDMHIHSTSDELISEKEKVVGQSSSGFFLDRFGLNNNSATVVKKLATKSIRSRYSASIESVKDFNSENLISDSTYNNVIKVPSGMASSRLDGQFDVGTNAFGSYVESGIEGLSNFEEQNEFQRCENKTLEGDVSFPTMDESMMQINSSAEQPLSKPEETNLDNFNIFRNNEAKHNESVTSLGLEFNTKGNLEFCSLLPSENEQAFGFQDDVSCLYDNTMDNCKEESSERGLLDQFTDDIFENKMYSTPLDGLKFDEDRDMNSNELSLAFGNPHALYPDTTIRVDQKKDLVGSSRIGKAFDVHTNLSMVNSSMVDELKAGGSSVGGLFNLSGNSRSSGFQSGSNTVYPNRAWDGLKSDEFKICGDKFISGFGSNQAREEVVPSGTWRSGGGNHLQSGLSNTSHAHIPSQSSFHSFNIMSDKAGEGQFKLDERYNVGYGVSGLRSNRPERVEFSFLGRSQHNPHPHQLQGDSRDFSYNPEMEQQFDSPFWLGKTNMMHNPAGRNQMPCVCAYCGKSFDLQQAHSGTQDGIGSLCPSCSASMSGHVNML